MNDNPIGVFDSGVGGISVLHALMDMLPKESFVYLADKSGLPYGNKSDEQINECVNKSVQTLLSESVKAIVVACNTATGVGIKDLRTTYNIPFVGVEPALKPAVKECKKGNILVLTTVATASHKKFADLFDACDNGHIIVAPQQTLAEKVEENIDCIDRLRGDVYNMLSRYKNVEGVVLGCTHYVFLRQIINDFYGGRIKIFDSGVGVAKRLKSLLEEGGLTTAATKPRSLKFMII